MSNSESDSQGIDHWLTRFHKMRSLASNAVSAGHVKLNGARPKLGSNIRLAGDPE